MASSPLRLFRYSGNKSKLLGLYRPLPHGVTRIVEPYLGSGAYGLNSGLPLLGYELNLELVELWHWLQRVGEKELRDLDRLVEDRKKSEPKPDVRDMGLCVGARAYVRVNVCSVVVGQLSSWKVYPQHRLPVDETIRCLGRLRDVVVVHGRGEDHLYERGDGLFIDPPYLGTVGNYGDGMEDGYRASDTVGLVGRRGDVPCMVTYGTNCREVFTGWEWEKVKDVRVPNMRRGGTVDRSEWVSYHGWDGWDGGGLFS
jgi:hypothetical protein